MKILSLTKKDFRVDTFRAGGHGGQNQNKRETGVRVTHKLTGFSSECRNYRSQLQNKKEAFKRLCVYPKFRIWLKDTSLGVIKDIERLEREVEKTMKPENLIIVIRSNGHWEKEQKKES